MDLSCDVEASERYFGDLLAYYGAQVGGVGECVCASLSGCSASVGADLFAAAQLSYVGPNYAMRQDGAPWRIAIVSMQVGEPESPISMIRRREQFSDRVAEEFRQRNAHIRGVTSALRVLFGREPGRDREDEMLETPTGPVHVLDAHALVNASLCSHVARPGSREGHATSTMQSNCQTHLRAALEILEPTIVHSQGRRKAKNFPTPHRSLLDVFDRVKWHDEYVATAQLGDRKVAWVAVGHPSAKGKVAWSHADSEYLVNVVAPALRRGRELALKLQNAG